MSDFSPRRPHDRPTPSPTDYHLSASRRLAIASYSPLAADGAFPLLFYAAPAPPPPALPLALSSLLTAGPSGVSLQLSLTARTALTRIVVRVPLGKGATGVSVNVNGGAFVEAGKPSGAGRWEVEEARGGGGGGGEELVWRVGGLRVGDRAATLQGTYLT